MDKRFEPQEVEKGIYEKWECAGAFTPKIDPKKKPFTIILPLPNANDPMHIGHAVFAIEDIMVRYHRMLGEPTLWLPGADHAGIETQYVFERHLAEKGQSRFDFDRQTLYQMIWDFVEKNRKINQYQMKKLGFSLDWTRYHYSLEPEIVEQVMATFRKLYRDGFIYRGNKIVNYCTHCGTAFSDLEVSYVEREDSLYFLDYGPVQIATTRPETIFADVAVAVNPKDKRFKRLIGQKAVVPLIKREVPIVADSAVEMDFGTGALKITPGHDAADFEIGQRQKLSSVSCIGQDGKMLNCLPEIDGLYPKEAREKTVELLRREKKLLKVEPLEHTVGVCYRCKNLIEPLLAPQWFIRIKPLADPAIAAAKKGRTKFFPARFKKLYLDWLGNIRDWPFSRQIVWGPRIPAWYCLDCHGDIKLAFLDKNGKVALGTYGELKGRYTFAEIENGLQSLAAPAGVDFVIQGGRCPKCGSKHLIQETDTFDTWFLSGQWPLTTLGFNVEHPEKSAEDFRYFYPTSVLDTLWDIIFFWVGRMMMFGLYLAGDVPFRWVHLHARVVDKKGQKMSKSKGNVIDPLVISEKYGADALRMALVFGVAPASDIVVSEEKVRAMRNFANKVWNIGRFTKMSLGQKTKSKGKKMELRPEDRRIIKELGQLVKEVTESLDSFYFSRAAEAIYQFVWHRLADVYIEEIKDRLRGGDPAAQETLLTVTKTCLKLLHPFMPFVTEAVWENLDEEELLITSLWPKS